MSATGDSDRGWLPALDRFVHRVTRWAATRPRPLVCAVLIVVTTFSVIVYQRGITIPWLDDVLRMLLIWLVYLGSVSLCFHNDHITMDALYVRCPTRVRRALNIAIAILGIVLCAYVSRIGLDSMLRGDRLRHAAAERIPARLGRRRSPSRCASR